MRKNYYYYDFISSNIGFCALVVSDTGVVISSTPEKKLEESLIKINEFGYKLVKDEEKTFSYKRILESYFNGENVELEKISLDLQVGTDFQKKVWKVCRKIKFGQLQSYKWISQKINGKPFSYRAVGSALKVNPVPIFIPCHRVIGENGNLCGYNSLQGISLKEKLINLEKNYEDSSIIE